MLNAGVNGGVGVVGDLQCGNGIHAHPVRFAPIQKGRIGRFKTCVIYTAAQPDCAWTIASYLTVRR